MSLKLLNITKRFGTILANDNISVEIGEGEIHGLLGENGAGKSTLVNIISGSLVLTQEQWSWMATIWIYHLPQMR